MLTIDLNTSELTIARINVYDTPGNRVMTFYNADVYAGYLNNLSDDELDNTWTYVVANELPDVELTVQQFNEEPLDELLENY